MATTPKKSSTSKSKQSGLTMTFSSANQNDYPIVYAEDQWDVVTNTNLKSALGVSSDGQFTQNQINAALADKIASVNSSLTNLDTSIFEVVDALPTDASTVKEQKIYIVVKSGSSDYDATQKDTHDEYKATVSGSTVTWELIGQAKCDLSGYSTTALINTKLADYATTSAMNTALSNYTTTSELNTTLAGYTTDSELTTALADYTTTADLNTTLEGYTTDSELTTTLGSYATTSAVNTKLNDYSTTAQINTKLADYATTSAMNTKLADYTTTADLNTTLEGYTTDSELTTTLSSYATTSAVNTKLNDYSTTAQINTKLADYATTSSVNTTLADYTTTSAMNTTLADYQKSADIAKQIAWVKSQMAAALLAEFDAKFTLTASASSNSYWADQASSTTQTVTATTKFDGTAVDATSVPSGWTKTAGKTGEYTKSSTSTISGGDFTYNGTGDYADLTTTETLGSYGITVNYPIFHGFMATKPTTAQAAYDALKTTRATTKYSNSNASLTNSLSSAGYYVILTHNSATYTVSGMSQVSAVANPGNISTTAGTTMTGYKLYVTDSSVGAGSTADKVNMVINL